MSQQNINSSLTSKSDFSKDNPFSANPSVTLTDEEVVSALQENLNTAHAQKKFPRIEKFFSDPIYLNQHYCLHSFVPAKGATPDKDGVFGMMKCRGTFQNLDEANKRAEWLIRNVDSYHHLTTGYVGRPFPVCSDDSKFAEDVENIDVKVSEVVSENIREKKRQEKQEIKEIKSQEEKLLEEASPEFEPDPLDYYITLRVKKANLEWTYYKTLEKMEEMKKNILDTREKIKEEDEKHPDFIDQFFERYQEARRRSGLDDEKLGDGEENFTRYLAEDLDIGF